ncbi:uncharacterized protein TRAVEDRAFT_54561 [Trametes versicolor FP-101664 SS1]|uniref:Uncharacterized protein n=1 Tax=Trametes versicolor (strain FP-101664) TaxID=717944 RepID=R7S8Z7_TRAVS|nr:uncharacterized protein TRAVEDRAFT_54561 [Trametes versicolor FP-101664 SS1]EIW51444.1 hypothetical protein TRAVEDRAFT_54561 [Trametes versicolor FP-101664 SS1]
MFGLVHTKLRGRRAAAGWVGGNVSGGVSTTRTSLELVSHVRGLDARTYRSRDHGRGNVADPPPAQQRCATGSGHKQAEGRRAEEEEQDEGQRTGTERRPR